MKRILRNPKHNQFAALYTRVMAQAHGNPTQPVTMEASSLPVFRVECE